MSTDTLARERLSLASAALDLRYDRARVTPGIVHLGTGAFHRAHMAVYVDDTLKDDPTWGIIGASLKRPDTRAALAPQDHLYTIATRDGSRTVPRVVGSLLEVLDAATQRDEIIAAMVDPRIRIVSLTITEKGYCLDSATGRLDAGHPDILHDIRHPHAPVSGPGLLVRALELRRKAGIPPFTVLSCDNLSDNGGTTARAVAELAAMRDEDLARHILDDVAFPSSMVDRIVPATTESDRDLVLDLTGNYDAWPVVAEPFSQWVIEDRFPLGRPRFETVGAQLVADVRPFEMMKLRMLNGSHSSLAYLGYLAGFEFVSEAIGSPAFRMFIRDLMTREVMPTLPSEVGDLHAYRDTLLDRFANPAIRHRTWQIAMDGSQKLPQRLLGTIRDCLARDLPISRASLGVAAWMRYVTGIDELQEPIDVRDPLAGRLRTIADTAGPTTEGLLDGMLKLREVFGDDLPRSCRFRRTLGHHLAALFGRGALATVQDVNLRDEFRR